MAVKRRKRKPVDEATKKKQKEFYVDPKEFSAELREFYDQGPDATPSNELGEKILKIAMKLSWSGNFKDYSFRDEMVSKAQTKMLRALLRRNYNFDKGNPFSYFTTIAWNEFVATIKDENKRNERHKAYCEDHRATLEVHGAGYENCRRETIDDFELYDESLHTVPPEDDSDE